MRCPRCQTANPDPARFCMGCGGKLSLACPHCGQELPPGARFCFNCGAALALTPSPRSPQASSPLPSSRESGEGEGGRGVGVRADPLPAAILRMIPKGYTERLQAARGRLGSERRLVTILFSDVKGSTAMAGTMDPEEWMDIMNGAFEFLIAPIYKHEGTLARLMGDAILAFFGAPLSHENDAELACRAALDIVAGARNYAARLERERGLTGFDVRVGINTGLVVVGEVGADMRVEYTAMGDAINMASRMEQAAASGTILITHDTYQLVRGLFDVQPLEPFPVKGRPEPLQAYQVERARPRGFRMATRGIEGVTTRMVGREAELLTLQQAFYDVVEEGRTRAVTVVGEAGLGKSRLLYEFEQWLGEQPQAVHCLQGRAGLEMQHIPYALLRDLFATQFQVQDSDPAGVAREKIEQGLCQVLGCDDAGRMKAHFIGQLVGFDFGTSPHLRGVLEDPRQLRDRAQLYLGEYIGLLVERTPVLLLLEDIHWADDSSLDTINQLAGALFQREQDTPLLAMHLARPTLYERRPRWGEGQPFHTRMALQPLSRRDSRRLVAEILQRVDQLPETLRDLVIEQSEGTPFYVEELIRMLIEDGVVVKGDDRWRVELDRLANLRVPPTLTGILQARLDGLRPEERTTLQQAAVMGRVFWDDAVCRLSAAAEEPTCSPDQVAEVLAALRGREMVLQRERSSFAGVEEYAFKHATLREVTYEGVLKKVRRRYHALVAEWLLERSGERAGEHTGLIAEHLDRAGRPAEAADYLRRAGEQAAARYANAEAADYLTRALRLTPEADAPGMYALLLQRERLYDMLGAREAQLSDIVALEALADTLDDDCRRAEVAACRAAYYEAVSDFAQAAEAAQAAVARAALAGDPRREVGGRIVWARALMRQGQFPEALAQLEQALALAQEAGDRAGEASSRHYLGTVRYFLGDYPAAREYLEQALEVRRLLGDRRGQGITLNNLGGVYHAVGDYALGKAVGEQALAVYQDIGDRRNEAQTLSNLGSIHYALGQLATARDHHLQALAIFTAIGDRRGAASAARNVGLVLYDLEDHGKARHHCEQAVAITRTIGDRAGEGYALNHLALVLEATEPPSAAAVYEQALYLRREIGQGACAVDDLAGLARSALRDGQVEPALASVEEALEWIAARGVHGIEYPLRVYLTAVDVFSAAGRPEHAGEALAAAQALLENQAARISDEHTRQAFLERVPLHRQVRERTGRIDPARNLARG